MKAGRKLDALVARRVLGWVGVAERRQAEGTGERTVLRGLPTEDADALREVPLYSTRIADAWHVVAAMRAKGYRMTLSDQPGTDITIAQFFTDDDYGASVGETTDAHAICMAALGALGEPRP